MQPDRGLADPKATKNVANTLERVQQWSVGLAHFCSTENVKTPKKITKHHPTKAGVCEHFLEPLGMPKKIQKRTTKTLTHTKTTPLIINVRLFRQNL